MPDRFDVLPLARELARVVAELGFETMTPIQELSLPFLLDGRDLVGQAKTGSGKTAAFVIPILQKIEVATRAPQALILCPTRELCAQVARETRRLGRHFKGLQVLVLAGGEPAKPQVAALEKGAHVLVGTPGRVLDLLTRDAVETDTLRTLVLDEADRMLDMGFEEEMTQILGKMPRRRQTVFFSATYPPVIKSWSRKYQHEPVNVKIDEAAPDIRHLVFPAEKEETGLLAKIVRQRSALVFCNQKATIAELRARLEREGVETGELHGDLEQRDRNRVLAMFRGGSCPVLLATDVAARGLDIQGLELVVHYDLPHESAAYVHRSGRTGRAGEKGTSVVLGTQVERARLREFAGELGFKIEKGELAEFRAKTDKPAGAAMQTLYISGGRKDKVRPGDILGALTGRGALTALQVGKIEIHDGFSFVAVARDVAAAAVQRLKTGGIKGRKFLVRIEG